jgi:transposase
VCVTCRQEEEDGGRVLLNRSVPNVVEQVADAIRSVPGTVVRTVGIEACSGAAVFAEELAGLTGWNVVLANAQVIARMKPTLDKTDRSDAKVIAELCRTGYLPKVWLAPEPIRQLRQLIGLRRQHVEAGKKAKLRILALLRELRIAEDPEIGRWTRAHIAWLKDLKNLPKTSRWVLDRLLDELEHQLQARRKVEGRLREVTAADPVVAELLKQPGVGEVTAWLLRAVVGDFARFHSGKQLAKYCGLSPRNVSSGDKTADAGVIKAGDGTLKATLMQAAHRLARHNPRWRELYVNFKECGKATNVAIVGIANRWIRWLFYQIKDIPDPIRHTATAAAA